jgi:hypothetical protein
MFRQKSLLMDQEAEPGIDISGLTYIPENPSFLKHVA